MTAFVLGAGKGTRLRPLTETWPKPLLPFASGKRLVEAAFDSLLANAPIEHLLVNTHWCAERWEEVYPSHQYQETPLHFIHEPTLLDTGGGLANIWSHWQGLKPAPEESLWLYNGDILSTAPLAPLLEAHQESNNLCTLLLRPEAGNVAFAASSGSKTGQVADLRGHLGRSDLPLLTYGGIALIHPDFARYLRPAGEIFSLVESWLELIAEENRLGGVLIEEGSWADLGTLDEWNAAKNLH